MSVLQDTAKVTAEIIPIFETSEDANTILLVNKLRADIDKLIIKKQTDARKLIKELSSRTQQLEQEVVRKESAEVQQARIQALERQKENISTSLEGMDKQSHQLKDEVEHLRKKTEELRARKQALEEQRLEDVPRIKLYQCVSNIKWDYEASAGHVKGHVDILDFKRKMVKDVRPFDIAPQQKSSFETTNYLWDLMED